MRLSEGGTELQISTTSKGVERHHEDLDAPLIPKGRWIPFLVVTPLFFLWAIPNNLTDILIRQFMKSFEVNGSTAAQLQSVFIGYFLWAIPAGIIMRRFGYKAGLVTGLVLMATGCYLFWPAAHSGAYFSFVVAQFVIGSGLSFLETGANPFIAQLGPADSSERRLNVSQAFNPLGSITAGLVGTTFIFSGVEFSDAQAAAQRAAGTYQSYLHSETLRVVPTYMVLGSVALLWALMVLMTRFPAVAGEDASTPDAGPPRHVRLMQRHFVTAILAQFLYVGAQVGTWSYFIPYVRQSTGLNDKFAGYMLTGTLGAFAVGRFGSSWLMKHIPARRMLVLYSMVNVLLCLVGVAAPNWAGVVSVLLTSFFMSIMFPTIFALGIKGMGDKTKTAGSLLVMAILGGFILTKVMGMLRDASSIQAAYAVPVVCYAAVAVYAWLWADRVDEPAG